jgi:hypothetical protein
LEEHTENGDNFSNFNAANGWTKRKKHEAGGEKDVDPTQGKPGLRVVVSLDNSNHARHTGTSKTRTIALVGLSPRMA